MHGSQPCSNPPSIAQHTLLHKKQPYLHPRLVKDCSGFLTMVRKKEMLLHHSPFPITTGRKHRAEPVFFWVFFSICIICNTQEKPFKRGGLFARSRAQKVKEQTQGRLPSQM